MNFAAWGPTTVPPAGFPLLTGGGSATQMLSVKTDDKGIASFDNVKITGGSFGHYYLVAVVKSAFNPDIAIVETQTTEDEPNDDTTADINLNAPLDNLDTGDLTPPSIPSPLDEPNSNFKFCQSVDQRYFEINCLIS